MDPVYHEALVLMLVGFVGLVAVALYAWRRL